MTGVLLSHRTLSSVPARSAARVGGRNCLSLFGQRTPTASVTAAMANALKLMSGITSGHDLTAPSGPPCATGAPRNGSVCSRMMITPMPDMNPGYHRVRRVGYESPDSQHAEENLYQPRHDGDRERFGEALSVSRDDDRHRNGHWARRSGYLRPCSPEDRCKKSYGDCPIDSGNCAKPRRHAECQRHWQTHHRCGDAAKDVSAECLEVVVKVHVRSTRHGVYITRRQINRPHSLNSGQSLPLSNGNLPTANTAFDEIERLDYPLSMPALWSGSTSAEDKSPRMNRNVT